MHITTKIFQQNSRVSLPGSFIILILLIFSLGIAYPTQVAAHAMPAPGKQEIPEPQKGQFSATECWTTVPSQFQERVTCGYVTVPESHFNPVAKKIRLAVMIIRAQGPDQQADPLFIAQGGPGGSTIDTYAEVLLTIKPLLSNRDIVLFDQRGTLYSEPALICTEFNQLLLDTIELDLEPEEYYKLELAASAACQMRLQNEGIDLDAYNSLENAADIQALRSALGYNQINLYGVSYGTLLALHTMRFYPQNLRSVILDSVVPPQTNFITEVPRTAQRSFDLLFSTCAQDPDCSSAYPNLENRFFQLVDDLNQSPVSVPMTDPDSGLTYQALINGDTFLDSIFQLLYATELIPAIPMTIVDASQGNFDFFARIMSIFIFDRSFSYGMYYTVLCSEDSDFDPQDISLEGIQEQIIAAEKDDPIQFLKTCDTWQVKALNDQMDKPVESQIPVLILSGSFDPITPPAYGQIVAEDLPNSYVVEFPTGGHGVALSGDCQDEIIRSFLDQPQQAPDLSCIIPQEELEFFSPKNIIQMPAIIQLLNLDEIRVLEFIVLAGAALTILPIIFFIPIQFWVRKSRKSAHKLQSESHDANQNITQPETPQAVNLEAMPGKDSQGSRINQLLGSPGWLLWFYTLVCWIFLSIFFSVIGVMLFGNDNRLFFGLSSQTKPLFVLPWIMILLTLLLGIAIFRSWRNPDTKFFQKLFYAFSWLVAFVILFILGRWEVFSAWLS